MAAAQEDIRLALEAQYTIHACADLGRITDRPGARAAIAESTAAVEGAAAAHRASVASVALDLGETDDARAGVGATKREAVARYEYVRSRATVHLLNPDPDEEVLSAEERTRRMKGLARTMGYRPSELQDQATRSVIERLDGVATALEKDPMLSPLGLGPKLVPALAALREANTAFERELGEDRAAYDVLEQARESLQRSLDAHRLQVAAPLTGADRADELGRFVLAADPAYSARRTAKAPIQEEPGAAEAEGGLGDGGGEGPGVGPSV